MHMNATRYLPFVGRLLIGLVFIFGGIDKLGHYGPMTALIKAVGLPLPPLAWAGAVALELGGGLLLVVGYQARLLALAMVLYCFVTAAFFHSNFADQGQVIHFLKNIIMAGGFLQIAGFGAGAISIDNWLAHGSRAAGDAVLAR
jgi:putative oxidoreductase